MLKIGITGQNGFIGSHLYNNLGLFPDEFERIAFQASMLDNNNELDNFVSKCDVIVHLAAMNRHENPQVIYDTNILLVNKLVESLDRTENSAHIIFSSSSQEENENLYGKSKLEGRNILKDWAKKNNGIFTGMIIPNVFGPFGKPFYNSVIATFCHQLTHNQIPQIAVDGELKLIYINELISEILGLIRNRRTQEQYEVPFTKKVKVSNILKHLYYYQENYYLKGVIPEIKNTFELNLFNTFRSFIDLSNHFPVNYVKHIDSRGAFVEVIRLGVGGQVSFSTTVPGITRGNHFHTRKIERFSVIKGKALIKLRKIGTDEVLNFHLKGAEPSYVDMPIWYTHNITNIGEEELYTIFWINEFFNPNDADTFMENV